MRIEYDPARLSYEDLLDVFWNSHDPSMQPWNRQYRNAVFTLNEAQRRSAEISRARIALTIGKPIETTIEPATVFTVAETYHQKYFLRHAPALFAALRASYADDAALTDSVAATRINGYLSCAGTLAELQGEIDDFGLTPALREQLLQYVATSCRADSGGPTCVVPPRRP